MQTLREAEAGIASAGEETEVSLRDASEDSLSQHVIKYDVTN